MSVDPSHITVGMDVFGIDGEQIGRVKEVHASEILVDRPFARDVYVPLDAIQAIVDTSASSAVDSHVTLTIRADSVGDAGWRHP
jgi:hypothetical protein